MMRECGYPSCTSIAESVCKACKKEWYCGREHQRADWGRHKKDCKLWKLENSCEDAKIVDNVRIHSFEEGNVCTIAGLQNRTDLNGFMCTVGKLDSKSSGRIPVAIVCDGKEQNLLVKRENLCITISEEDSGLSSQEIQRLLSQQVQNVKNNTIDDVREIRLKYSSLIDRLEEAISHRNQGRCIVAEHLLEKLLTEAEDLCGKHSVMVATFVKSFAILRAGQRRWSEAEDMFIRADELRPADCEDNEQGTSTLEHLFAAQLERRLLKKASGTLIRIKRLQHYIRPGIDSDLHRLDMELTLAKSSPSPCVVCGRRSVLLACARCHLTVYCSRSCQKIHWKFHKRACQLSITPKQNPHLQSTKLSVDDDSSFEMIENASIDTDILMSSILCNAKATISVNPSCPTEMDITLLAALADAQQSYFFCMNDVTSSALLETDGGRRRFLATAGVFSCITVFAWSKSTCANSPGLSFGAHVSLGALLRGLRLCKHAKHDIDRALAPLLLELRCCFQGSTQDIMFTVVGGHRAMDNIGLKALFPNDKEKWSFAWHIKNACETAFNEMPNKVVWKTNLLLRFEGEMIKNEADEVRVRKKNMNFMVVALDTITGHLLTHTRYTNMGSLLVEAVLSRQLEAYTKYNDPKLRVVSHKNEGS